MITGVFQNFQMTIFSAKPADDSIESKNLEKSQKFDVRRYYFVNGLSFKFLPKMPALSCFWNSHPSKVVATIMDKKELIALTDFILKKFREISIYNSVELPLVAPPMKRRKLLPSDSVESKKPLNSTESTFEEKMDQKITLASCKRKRKHKRSPNNNSPKVRKSKNVETNSRTLQNFQSKLKVKVGVNSLLSHNTSSPLKSAEALCPLFSGCVNFVRASKFSTMEDTDLLMKKVVKNGNVVSKQDHWSEPDCKNRSHWTGALVVYKHIEDSYRIIDDFFLRRDSSLVPVYVPQQLTLIGHLEAKMPRSTSGSSILIAGIRPKTCRKKLNHELQHYGEVLSCNWTSKDKDVFCEVTYSFTVEAVAAALALNGKRVGRVVLKTRIKMTQREVELHMMVCSHFC